MKIGIVGAGAMGCVYAALMADAGNEVWAIDTWQAHVNAIAANGAPARGRERRSHGGTGCDQRPHDRWPLRSRHRRDQGAAGGGRRERPPAPLLGPETAVLTIQNGLGSAAKVARILGEQRVIVGVVGGFGASIVAPGHAHHNGMELVRLGEAHGAVTPRLEHIAALWRESGFRVKCFDDIDQLVWEKLICNVCYSGTATLLRGSPWARSWRMPTLGPSPPAARRKPIGSRAPRASGSISTIPVAYVHDFGAKIPGARPSMLLDHMAGRRSEFGRDQRRDPAGGSGARPGSTLQHARLGAGPGQGDGLRHAAAIVAGTTMTDADLKGLIEGFRRLSTANVSGRSRSGRDRGRAARHRPRSGIAAARS